MLQIFFPGPSRPYYTVSSPDEDDDDDDDFDVEKPMPVIAPGI